MTLDQLYQQFNQLEACRNFCEAEKYMQQILQVPGQAWQQYLYLPAEFYEAWGDYAVSVNEKATQSYTHALHYRYQIGHQATGSGEGMEAMYHIKRIQNKLKQG